MNKSAVIALIVFVVLGAAAVTLMREKPERGITRLTFASMDPDKTDRIVVEGPTPVVLERKADTWKLGELDADPNAVTNLLTTVKRVDSTEVVSRNRTRFSELEVDGDKAVHVQTFSGGAKTADFFVGTATAGGSNVRVDDTVYLVKRLYKGAFAREHAQWLDRKLFADKVEDVTRVDVQLTGKEPYTLVKDGKDWKLDDASAAKLAKGFRFDRSAASSFAAALVAAQASDVLADSPDDATTGLGDEADSLSFQLGSGDPRTLRLGATKDGNVYARASTRKEIVTLPENVTKSLRKQLTDLRDLSLMDLDVSSAKRLTIVKDKDRLVLEKDGATWTIAESTEKAPEKFELDSLAVSRRLGAIRAIRGLGVAPDGTSGAAAGLDKPTQTATVTLADDRTVTLAFGKDTKLGDTDGVFAHGNADAETYVVAPFARNNVLGGIATFAKNDAAASPLGNIDPKALENLPPGVRDSLLKQIQQKRRQEEALRKAMEQQGAGEP
jgi:hypothetical protein